MSAIDSVYFRSGIIFHLGEVGGRINQRVIVAFNDGDD